MRLANIWLFLSLFGFWVLLSAHLSPLFLSLGTLSALMVFLVHQRMYKITKAPAYPDFRLFKNIAYFWWLFWQIVKSNIQIAKIILNPFLPIQPHFISIPLEQKSQIGKVIFANSITLTPGTVSVETRGDRLIIHALTQKSGETKGLRQMSRKVLQLEGDG